MIRMSRWRRWSVVAMLAASPVLGAVGCGYPCSAVGCLEGLNVLLSGGFDPDRTYTIELSRLTAAGASPVMTCARTWPSTGSAQMSCTSALRFQADPWWIEIFDSSISALRVSISVDGAIVGQQDFSVRFTSNEDCGTCTTASVEVPFPVRPIWGTQGDSVFVNCGSDDLGATSFTATRDQLSSEQLQLLSAMQEVPNPAPAASCRRTADMDCFMRVSYNDNTTADHWARPSDETCDPSPPEKLVSFATFDPFRQTLGCWYSKQLTAAANEAAAGSGPLPALDPNAVCEHGIVPAPGTTRVGLKVLDGASHHIALHNCNLVADQGQIELQLFDPTGSALLARSAAPTTPVDPDDGTCQAIDFTFPAAGTYVLEMVVPPSYESPTAFLSYE